MTETLTIGALTIDRGARQVTRAGEPVELSDLSFDLLAALAEAAPEPLSPDELAARVWGRPHVTDHTIAQRVAMVRKALGDNSDAPAFIRTVRGKGYAFIVPAAAAPRAEAVRRPRAFPGRAVFAGLAAALTLVTSAVVVAGWRDQGDTGDIAAVLVDPTTGAVRISGAGPRFVLPVLASVEGTDLFVGSVPELTELEGSPAALAALCGLADDPSRSSTPVPRELRAFLGSRGFREACEGAGASL